MVARWASWLGERLTGTKAVPRAQVAAEFGLLIDVFASMIGPLRRETKPI